MSFDDELRLTLEVDEGKVLEIYDDHLGNKTCGIGHLIVESDREFEMPVGTPIDHERVTELFEADIASVLRDVDYLFPDFLELPDPARVTIASLMFQLGLPRYGRFVKHREAIERHAQRLEGIA